MVDSTTPTARATENTPAALTACESCIVVKTAGTRICTIREARIHIFRAGCIFDHGQVRAAVIQNHDFVNHGQFKMRVGIVKRNPAALKQENDKQGTGQQKKKREGIYAAGKTAKISLNENCLARQCHDDKDNEKESSAISE